MGLQSRMLAQEMDWKNPAGLYARLFESIGEKCAESK